jgi:hypothetical protein
MVDTSSLYDLKSGTDTEPVATSTATTTDSNATSTLSASTTTSATTLEIAHVASTTEASTSTTSIAISPPSSSGDFISSNIYALTERLTPEQTRTFLQFSLALGVVGFLLAEYSMLATGCAWFVSLFASRRRPVRVGSESRI